MRDRPDRAGLGIERRVAVVLRERTPKVTERWHQELLAHLKVRPQAVFPSDELLDHMPLVVDHVVSLVETDPDIPEATLAALRAVADHWRDAGYTVEEALLHFRVLNRVLHQELRALIEATTPPVSGTEAARIAESLSHGSTLVQAVVVGTYRDRQEERFGEYAGALAHEVRGPLSAALTGLHALAALDQEEPGERGQEQRQRMMERIERTLLQIRDVFEAVTTLVAPEPLGLGDEEEARPLADVVDALRADFGDRRDGVRFEYEGDIPDGGVPYKTVLLVLHNLVRNAVSYSDPEKTERWVRLSCDLDEDGDRWLLRVRDNGIGIPEQEQDVIFGRFRRVKDAPGEGLGLGLSIVREAARRMDGHVSVESEPGKGSTFTVSLPAAAVGPASTAPGA